MGFLENIGTIKGKIQYLLERKEGTKDNDDRLIALFWWYEVGGEEIEKMSANDLLFMFANHKLTNPETIRRCRQKLQEEFPGLRGLSYKSRKKEGEVVKQEINK